MEDLQGGILTLERRYEVLERAPTEGVARRYRGTLHPSGLAIDIWVLDGLERLGLPPRVAASVAARLRALSRKACRLRSPYVLRVIDYGELDARTPFQIADAATGPRLEEIIQHQGRLPLEGTLRVVRELAEALDEAHAIGFGHLAVRPESVWFEDTASGPQARLGCWGHSLLRHELSLIDGARLGNLAARFNHLAPETFHEAPPARWLQALAPQEAAFDTDWGEGLVQTAPLPISPSPADPVAFDVFGLALLTFRCLTGEHPFTRDQELSLAEQLRALESAAIPEHAGFSDLPAPVWRVLRSGLARDPGARPASALGFAEQLEAAWAQRQRPAPAPRAAAILPAPAPGEPAAEPAVEATPAPLASPSAPLPDPEALAALELEAAAAPLIAHPVVRYLAAAAGLLLVTNLVTLLLLGAAGPTPSLQLEALPADARWTRLDAAAGPGPLEAPPARLEELPPGRYRVEAPGARALEIEVEASADGRRLRLHLPPLAAAAP